MCYFIVVALPSDKAQELLKAMPPQLHVAQGGYTEIEALLGNCEKFTITKGMCSCDLFFRGSVMSASRAKKLRRHMTKRGKCESEIAQAIALWHRPIEHGGLYPDLRRWLAEAAHQTGEAYLFVHWDSNLTRHLETVHVKPNVFADETWLIEEDVLYCLAG